MTNHGGGVAPEGVLALNVIRADDRAPMVLVRDRWVPDVLAVALKEWSPRSDLGRYVREVVAHRLPREISLELIERMSRTVIVESALALKAHYGEWAARPFTEEDFGIVGRKVVTDVGVAWIVDVLQNVVDTDTVLMKFHGLGTGSTAEAVGDTALVTELTTEYTGNVRATGTTTETAANIYSSVATNTLDGTPGAALREHGLFTLNAAGVLLDRTVFAAITLVSGDGLQSSYFLTLTSGG